MKSFIVFLIIGILSYVAGIWWPWWSVAIVAFVVTLVSGQRPFAAFITAFLAVFIFWFSFAFFRDLANDHILADQMSVLFFNAQAPVLLMVVSGFIGAIVAGFAALSASFLRTKKRVKRTTAYV